MTRPIIMAEAPGLKPAGLLGAVPTAMSGWIARIVTAACQLLTVRILSESLGVDGFAAYVTIASLQTWFILSDLGYGSAVQNHVSRSRVRGDEVASQLTGALILLLGFGLALALLVIGVSLFAGPALLSNLPAIGSGQAALALGVFGAVSVGTGVANIALRLLFAEHRGYLAHAATAAAALTGVFGVWVLRVLAVPDPLAASLFVSYLPVFLFPLALLVRRMRRGATDRLPVLLGKGRTLLVELGGEARGFLLFSALAACVLNVDYIVMAQIFDAQQILVYTIATRFLSLFFILYFSFTQASWPVSAEMIAHGTPHQLPRLIASCIAVGVVAVSLGGAGLLLFPSLIAGFIAPGKDVLVPFDVAALFTLYWLVRVWCDTFSMVIMSTGDMKIMRFVVPGQAIINIVLLIAGAHLFGLPGLIAGSTLSFLLTVAWIFPLKVRRIMRAAAGA